MQLLLLLSSFIPVIMSRYHITSVLLRLPVHLFKVHWDGAGGAVHNHIQNTLKSYHHESNTILLSCVLSPY